MLLWAISLKSVLAEGPKFNKKKFSWHKGRLGWWERGVRPQCNNVFLKTFLTLTHCRNNREIDSSDRWAHKDTDSHLSMIWIWFNQLTLYLNPSSWHSSMLPMTLMNVSLSWAHAWPCLHDLTRESDLRQRCHVPRHGDNWHQSHDHHQRSCWPQNHDPCAFCSQDTYLHIWQVSLLWAEG